MHTGHDKDVLKLKQSQATAMKSSQSFPLQLGIENTPVSDGTIALSVVSDRI